MSRRHNGERRRGDSAPRWFLFSATPYRNDLKIFEVNQDFTSFVSFQAAAEGGLIRPVDVEERALPFASRSIRS